MSRFLQAYYTSCEKGMRGIKGFQFNAASPELDARLLQKLERLCTYVPPSSAPSQPVSDEDLRKFPVSFMFTELPEKKYVLAQIKYIGQDYSRRFGNYFVHALIAQIANKDDKPFVQNIRPIDFWNAPIWKTTEERESTELLALAATEIQKDMGLLNPEKFFLQDERRLAQLPRLISAAIESFTSKRPLVIIDDQVGVEFWIAALMHALPTELALQLSFNTYVANPRQADFRIMGLAPDNDPRFSAIEMEHQYFVFDFVRDRFSPIKEISTFAKDITALYKERQFEAIVGFSRYADQNASLFILDKLGEELQDYADRVGLILPGRDIRALIKYRAAHPKRFDIETPESIEKWFKQVNNENEVDRALLEACTKLYNTAQEPSFNSLLRKAIESYYISWLLKKACEKGRSSDLFEVLDNVSFSDFAAQCARQHKNDWYNLFTTVKDGDPIKLLVLVKLGEQFGFLSQNGNKLREIGEKNIAPKLSTPYFQAILKNLAGNLAKHPALSDIFQGVAAYFSEHSKDSDAQKILRQLSDSPGIMKELRRYAGAKNKFDFYNSLLESSTVEDKDSVLWQHIIELLHAETELSPGWFDELFSKHKPDALKWMAWCRGSRLDSFENTNGINFIEKLFNQALQQYQPDRRLFESCTNLFAAVQNRQKSKLFRPKVNMLYLSWVLKTFCRKYKPEEIVAILEQMQLPKPSVVIEPKLVAEWIKLFNQDINRGMALLELGVHLGIVNQPIKELESIGETLVGPMLNKRHVLETLIKIADKIAGNNLLSGVGAYLSKNLKDRDTKALLEQLCSSDAYEIKFGIKEYAAAKKDAPLLLSVISAEASKDYFSGTSYYVYFFQTNIKYFSNFKGETFDRRLNEFFNIFWEKKSLEISQATVIANTLRQQGFSTEMIGRRLYQTLVNEFDALECKHLHVQLAQALDDEIFDKALGKRKLVLEAIQVMNEAQSLEKLIACWLDLRKENSAIVNFDKVVTKRLVKVENSEQHAGLLIVLLQATNGEFLKIYIENVKKNFAQTSDKYYVGRLFLTWVISLKDDSIDGKSHDLLVKSILPELVSKFSPEDLQELTHFFTDPIVKKRWKEYLSEMPQKNLIKRLLPI